MPIDVARWRLHNQRISHPLFEQPADVVQWLVASQAQDYAGAKWALGLRMKAATDRLVEQAFDSGAILRTHVMRPTWHFVAPADIRWLLALTAPRVHAANGFMYRSLELDDRTAKRGQAALAKALQGGRHLIRAELDAVLRRAKIETRGGQRLAYLVMAAELDGVICSGPRRGKQFTYALLAERAPRARTLARDEALAELTGRYLQSRGPATAHDIAKWSGLTLADARRGLDMVRDRTERIEIAGREHWFVPPTPAASAASRAAHLLSVYDEYVSSYRHRAAIADETTAARLRAVGNALAFIIVVDGRVVGTWKRTIRGKEVVVHLNPFGRLTRREERAIVVAADRYGVFLERAATVA